MQNCFKTLLLSTIYISNRPS